MNKVTDKTLYDFCVLYRQQFGQIQDATRFRNELGLRFYYEKDNPQELLDRCVKQGYIIVKNADIIIKA